MNHNACLTKIKEQKFEVIKKILQNLNSINNFAIQVENKSECVNNCQHTLCPYVLNQNDFTNIMLNLITDNRITPDWLLIIANYDKINKTNIKQIINLNSVEIKNSQIHGNGVFATKNICVNEVITLYPFHLTLNNEGSIVVNNTNLGVISSNDYDRYIYRISNDLMIAGLPQIKNNMTYVGHMINDNSNSKFKASYEREAFEKSNCSFVKIIDYTNECVFVVVVAITDIQIGEELFVPYGHEYWIHHS